MSRRKKRRKKKRFVDSFKVYMRDVRGVARLEPEEEQRLALLLEDGRRATAELAELDLSPDPRSSSLEERERRGRKARDRIVVANLRFVVHLARKFVRRRGLYGLELLDLIQEGSLGLLRAAERFEAGRGKLSTFAARWIWRSFESAVEDQSRIVRLPVHVHRKLRRLRKVEQWYHGEKGRPPTREELAAELGIDVLDLAELRGAEREVLSLDQPVPGDDDEDERVRADLVADPRALELFQRVEDREWLGGLLAGLPERSRRILASHFGLDSTLAEIGRREGLSRERVRQIVRDALERLHSSSVRREILDRTL